jgi:hypothetical protein
MKLRFTLFCIPRTKKNHPQLVPASQIQGGMARILPSKAFSVMFKAAKPHITKLRKDFAARGVTIPIEAPVAISAQFYRKQRSGDWDGFVAGLLDMLQWKDSIKPDCENCECRASEHAKGFCPTGKAGGYRRAQGAKNTYVYRGLIQDDIQVRHMDGTRLHVDHKNPRIEVCIERLPRDDGDQLALAPDEPDEQELDAQAETEA